MRVIYRSSFSIFLSLVITFTSAPFHAIPKAHAQTNTDELTAEQEHEQSLNELRAAFTEEGVRSAHLDPFMMSRQVVVDEREAAVQALVEETVLEDFLEREAYYHEQIASLNELLEQVNQRVSALAAHEKDVAHELQMIYSDIESRLKIAQMELADLAQFDPRRGQSLPVDVMVDDQVSRRHYWGNQMRIQFVSEGEAIHEINQKEFTQSLSPRFNRSSNDIPQEQNVQFQILNKRGDLLHRFLNPVSDVTFFGHYLVFTEQVDGLEPGQTLPVRFIDLNYARANIGNAPLPVFTLPLNYEGGGAKISHENGYINVGGQRLNYHQLALLSQAHQVLFNVSVALVDPNSHDNARPLIAQTVEFFRLSMESKGELFQDQIQQALNTEELFQSLTSSLETKEAYDQQSVQQLIDSALADGKIDDNEFEAIKTAMKINDSLKVSNEAVANGRRFMVRMRMLMQYLIQPRPEGAPKLLNAMMIAAAPKAESERSRALDFIRNGFTYKVAKYGAAGIGVLLAGDMLPEPYKINLYKSLDLVSATYQHFQGYLQHINFGGAYLELAKDAVITSTTGWTYAVQAYFADGQWSKFLYGLGSVLLVPIQIFGSIHFAINGSKMLRETLKVRRLSEGSLGLIQSFKEAAKRDQKAYWDSLSDAEKKSSGSDVSAMTEADIQLLDDHLERLRSGRDGLDAVERDIQRGRYGTKTALRSLVETLAGYKKKFHFGGYVTNLFKQVASKLSLAGGENTVRSALANAFLSYSSLRSTFRFNALLWNFFFMTRTYFWTPHKYLIFLMYPNYFKAAVTSNPGRQHFPSVYNSGLETMPQKLQRVISNMGLASSLQKIPGVNNLLVSEEGLEALKSFEASVVEIEKAAIEIAKTKAQMALMENIKDPERLMVIFDSAQNANGFVTTGVRNLNDKKLKILNNKERVFYQAYFTRSFDLIMQKLLSDVSGTSLPSDMDPLTFAKTFRRAVINGEITLPESGKTEVKTLTQQLEESIDFRGIKDWADQVANNGSQFMRRAELKLRHNLLQSMDPANYQVNRFLTVRNKVEEPRAMERAMRMEVSSMITGIPMAIFSTLALYAGVETGMLRPFDPEAMNTETHYIYMSRYLFYNGFIPGLILGMLANTWFKLQEDNRIDQLGGFDKAIKHSDGVRGFWRYYLKNLFKNPKNKWKDNHVYMLKLIYANIPAAAVTMLIFNLYGLGRVDIGILLSTYFLAFTFFLTGFNMKVGQAFELASAWVYNKVPRSLRAHPKAQKYINNSLLIRKSIFGFVENIWGIVVNENIAGDMLTLKDNVKYGTRAFMRLVFGGDTPTEIAVRFAENMGQALRNVPGASSIFEGFKHFISNNYEAFERFPERLPQIDGVPQVTQDPNLPQHRTGEILGKLGGLAATWGTITAIPYVVTNFLQRWRETRIQIQGEEAQRRQAERPSAPQSDTEAVAEEIQATEVIVDDSESTGLRGLTCQQVFQ
jgi:hypothetical protein